MKDATAACPSSFSFTAAFPHTLPKMTKGTHLTAQELFYVKTGHASGRRLETIANELERSVSAVRKAVVRQVKERAARAEGGEIAQRRNRIDQLLRMKVRRKDPKSGEMVVVGRKFPTARALRDRLVAEGFEEVSISTAFRDAKVRGARCLVRPKVADDTPKKNATRLVAAKEMIKKQSRDYVFCDETHVNTNDNTHGRELVPAGEKPTSRHFLKRAQCRWMVWAAIGYDFKSELVFFERDRPNHTAAITGAKYEAKCLPIVKRCLQRNKRRYIFAQDNARPHIKARKSLINEGFNVAVWPPYSPMLNPIEHLWSLLHHRIAKHYPRTDADLEAAARAEWAAISQAEVNAFVLNFESRLRACIEADGAPV